MKRLVVNIVAFLVIGMGGLSLIAPQSVNAAVAQEVSKCTAANGASCTCSGSCTADSDSCECT